MGRWLLISIIVGLCASGVAGAQTARVADDDTPAAIRVFLDCRGGCDGNYIRTELNFVDHVTDREAADVHVLITNRGTGGGGVSFTLSFIGLGRFATIEDTSTYTTTQHDSADDVRKGLARALKVGLMRYVALTPLRDSMDVTYRPSRERRRPTMQAGKDPWNFWVFRLRGNTDLSGEESSTSTRLSGNANASRVTEAWKFGIGTGINYRRNRYSFDDEDDYVSVSRDSSVSALAVKSIGTHWGAGARVSTSSSTYVNQARVYRAAPAIEYNVFPYADTTRRQLTFRYAVGVHHLRYNEVTIYDKLEETIAGQSLVVNLDMRQPWGQLGLQAEASQYVPDFDKHRLGLQGGMEVRIFKGLSLSVGADTSSIRDQIYLPAEGATPEEILLRQRQVATAYDYRFSVGLSYSFGSVYNNVVNSRLSGF
jgi:hypothetical protein